MTLSATDGGSGLSQMRFSNDGVTRSAWQAYGVSSAWTLSAGDGLKTVRAQYRDVAGNISAAFSDTILLDATLPAGSIVINGGAAAIRVTTATLGLSATDGGSGLSQMRFSNDGATWSAWQPYGTSKAWALSASNGLKTVRVQYQDGAGNISAAFSDTILLDTFAPTGSIAINAGAAETTSTAVTLGLSATDGGSGVAQMRFSNNGTAWSAWQANSTQKAWTTATGNGVKTVSAQFSDVAGNISTAYSDTIRLNVRQSAVQQWLLYR